MLFLGRSSWPVDFRATAGFSEFDRLGVAMPKVGFELDVAAEGMLAMLASDEVDALVARILNLIKLLLDSSF